MGTPHEGQAGAKGTVVNATVRAHAFSMKGEASQWEAPRSRTTPAIPPLRP
jgi:hypothetical protein